MFVAYSISYLYLLIDYVTYEAMVYLPLVFVVCFNVCHGKSDVSELKCMAMRINTHSTVTATLKLKLNQLLANRKLAPHQNQNESERAN